MSAALFHETEAIRLSDINAALTRQLADLKIRFESMEQARQRLEEENRRLRQELDTLRQLDILWKTKN